MEHIQTLPALQAALADIEACRALQETATNVVFADGNPAADIMLIGEAPGREEDLQGKPFVGRSGQLLDKMLAAIGLDRTSVYIANMLFWRPPENRTPTPQELAACRPYVERHIALIQPKLMLLVGGTSAKAMLQTTTGITKMRGTFQPLTVAGLAAPIPAMPLYHPAYLLRNPPAKKDAWADLQIFRERAQALGLMFPKTISAV